MKESEVLSRRVSFFLGMNSRQMEAAQNGAASCLLFPFRSQLGLVGVLTIAFVGARQSRASSLGN